MKHRHHLTPKHRGGTDDESNLTPPIHPARCEDGWSSHAMFHFCEWQLWGMKEDWLAWRGLAGFSGKEEIIAELMKEGRKKAREANRETTKRLIEEGVYGWQDDGRRAKAIEASLVTQRKLIAEGKHSLQDPEMRARRAEEDRVKRKKEFELGVAVLQRPDIVEKRKRSSSSSRSSQNSTKVTCPHCGKVGGHTNMKRYHFDKCKALLISPVLTT